MAQSLRDLVVDIGINVDSQPLTRLDQLVEDLINRLGNIDLSNLERMDTQTNNINNNLNNINGNTQNSTNSVGGLRRAIGGLAAVVATVGLVEMTKNFTVGAIEAAAEAQAMGAQFDQVFKDLGGQAQSTIDQMGESFGMLPERIKPAYTTMTSMFMGLGLETEEAMGASERAVTAVADAAAFYDKSFEDANGALNSFIKGNYEGGESIGLFASETQLASWAADELGVKWDTLGEADKQLSRLKYAETMMEAAGATGQAARESESYQNQLGNVKQAWENFLAKAGTPILEQAVGVLKNLTDVISNVDPGPFMQFISDAASGLDRVKTVGEAVADTFQAIFSGDVTGVSNIWENLGIPPEVANTIESFAQSLSNVFQSVKGAVDSFVEEVLIPLTPQVMEFIGPAMTFIGGVVDVATNAFGILSSAISGVINGVIVPLFPVAQSVISTVMDVISPLLRIVGTLFSGISATIRFLVENVVVPLFPIIAEVIEEAWIAVKPILDAMADTFDVIADSVEWVVDKIGILAGAIKKLDIKGAIGSFIGKATGSKLPGFEVGLGRVPYDDMPALLHKDEAVLPADEADRLRDAGILKGEGTDPSVDFSGINSYATSAPVTTTTSSTSTVHAPVQIIVQGGKTNEETGNSVKDAIEEFFADLTIILPQPGGG